MADIQCGLESQAQSREAMRTPAARWREEGKPDPHGARYDCERAQIAGGHLTDDEVANAVFLDPSIENLTIAKDRIRWLSRQLEAARRS